MELTPWQVRLENGTLSLHSHLVPVGMVPSSSGDLRRGPARPRWSITLASPHQRRPRWLAENGRFTSDPTRALRMVNPEVAVRRLHAYLELRGWPTEALERFRLVPAPGLQPAVTNEHLEGRSSSAA